MVLKSQSGIHRSNDAKINITSCILFVSMPKVLVRVQTPSKRRPNAAQELRKLKAQSHMRPVTTKVSSILQTHKPSLPEELGKFANGSPAPSSGSRVGFAVLVAVVLLLLDVGLSVPVVVSCGAVEVVEIDPVSVDKSVLSVELGSVDVELTVSSVVDVVVSVVVGVVVGAVVVVDEDIV